MSTSGYSFQDLEAIYNDAWVAFPYTNMPGIRLAINLSGKPLTELLQMSAEQWKSLKSGLMDKFDESDDAMNTMLLWEGIGTCTTRQFCRKLVQLVDNVPSRVEKVKYKWRSTSDGSSMIEVSKKGRFIQTNPCLHKG